MIPFPTDAQAINFRPYQQGAHDATVKWLSIPPPKGGCKKGIVAAPVAAGKSFLIAGAALHIDAPTIVLQPNQELLQQNYEKFTNAGGIASIYCAGLKQKVISKVTFATLASVKNVVHRFKALGVKHVIIDEAHWGTPPKKANKKKKQKAGMFRSFIEQLNPSFIIGYTATPCQLKASMYGSELKFITRQKPSIFNEIIYSVQVQEIYKDYWAPLVYEEINFNREELVLNSTGAEYTKESISRAVKQNDVNRQICRKINSLRHERKSILVFVDSVQSAQIFAAWCQNKLGMSAAAVYGDMYKSDRDLIINGFKTGVYQVVFNVQILTAGFDHPAMDWVILGRPTNSFALYYQKIGRGTRLHPEGKDCLITDFCGNVQKFGPLEGITIQNVYGWGDAICNNGRVLTNVPMGSDATMIEIASDSICKKLSIYGFFFGKHKGVELKKIPSNYLSWFVKKMDEEKKTKKVFDGYLTLQSACSGVLKARDLYDAHF